MNDRAVSTAVTWALTMLITTLLITGLLVATGNQIRDRTESVTRSELEVIGQQLVSDLSAADRLAQSEADTVTVQSRLPDRVAHGTYRVEISATVDGTSVRIASGNTAVTVPMANRTAVQNASLPGGDLHISLDGGILEVSDA